MADKLWLRIRKVSVVVSIQMRNRFVTCARCSHVREMLSRMFVKGQARKNF